MQEHEPSQHGPDLPNSGPWENRGDIEAALASEDSSGRPGLLEARRRFLVGTLGMSTFAATLAARPALAGGGGGGGGPGPITALCSPTHSHASNTKPCYGSHPDHWCNEGRSWSSDCYRRLSSCGFKSSYCNSSRTIKDCLSSAYSKSSYSPGGWNFRSGGSNYNYSGGWWSYRSDNDSWNLECWLACGWLNAKYQPSMFGYDCDEFVSACETVLKSRDTRCATDVKAALCQRISSMCTQNRSNYSGHLCGGSRSIWTM